jgi:hypothetical protein
MSARCTGSLIRRFIGPHGSNIGARGRCARHCVEELAAAPVRDGFPFSDEHIIATVLGIADELTYDGLLLRYRSREQTMAHSPADDRTLG